MICRPVSERGFTLLELLIVVAIIGTIVAIAVPNLVNALHRARQKRTMSSVRHVSQGIEMYEHDHGFYPDHADVPLAELADDLALYVTPFDPSDGWNRMMWYSANGDYYTVMSFGRDGVEDASHPLGPTGNFAADILFSAGVFIQWPAGIQRE